MSDQEKILVVSLGQVNCDGRPHPPEEEWECPADQVGRLVEVGAVRLATRPADIVPIRPTAKAVIAQVSAVNNLQGLNDLAEGEERKTVLEAIDKRRAELEDEVYIAHLAAIDTIEALEEMADLEVNFSDAVLEAIENRRTELENQ